MIKKEYKFGIYTSFYNAERFIDDIFKQFEAINYQNWKWIVTDDFSSDNTKNLLIQKCKQYDFVEYVEQQHKKEMYWQPNKFFDDSFDYVVLMDCDDEFDVEFLNIYNHFANQYPDAVYLTSDMIKIEGDRTHSLSLIHNHTNLLDKLDHYHPLVNYVNNPSYYCLGYLRCFKNIPTLDFKIDDFNACAEDSYRAMYMNSLGKWLHIPRVLYKWIVRKDSESHSQVVENFNGNFDGAYNRIKDQCYDPYYDFQDVYKETSALQLIGTSELHNKNICIISRGLTNEQKNKLRNLYFDCELFFNKQPNCDHYVVVLNYFNDSYCNELDDWIKINAGSCKTTYYYFEEECHENMDALNAKIAKKFHPIIDSRNNFFMYFRHNYTTIQQEKKNKLLFIAPHLSTGGSPAYLEWLIGKRKSEGYDVKVLEYSYYGAYDVQRKRIKKLVGDHNFISFCTHWEDDEKIISRGSDVVDMVKKINPDIIHLNEISEIFCYKPFVQELKDYLYNPNKSFKLIETCHTSEFDFKKKTSIPDEFHFCSPYHATLTNHIDIPKILVDMELPKIERPDRKKALSNLELSPDYYHVLNVGLFNEFKNQKYIFELASKLQDYKIQFHFIGNDCYLGNCGIDENLLNLPNCIVHGEKNNVLEYMAAVDLFLFSSLKELNPICLKEAISCDLPIFMYNLDVYNGHYDNHPLISYIKEDNVLNFLLNKMNTTYDHIINESGSLGDCLAWAPIVAEYARQKGKNVNYYTPHKDILEDSYPQVNFYNYSDKNNITEGEVVSIGCFTGSDWQTKNLQKVATDILGMEFKEVRCQISHKFKKKNNFDKKYVCIGTQSTAQAKYWNNPTGWQQTVDYIKELGYEVVCIDRNASFGVDGKFNYMPKNCIDRTGDFPLQDRINDLFHCEFFIGLGSGLSWLAWACGKPVIMISGFSAPYAEFTTPYRLINENVCNSCWNDTECKFDANNWLWCPRDKNFECSKEISFDMVKEKINQLLNIGQKNIHQSTYHEIFELNQYQQFVQVEQNDFVLDVGCSQGPFYFQNKDKHIDYVGVDASIHCIEDFYSNLTNEDLTIINAIISPKTGIQKFNWFIYNEPEVKVNSITFPALMKLLNRKIDFFKFDIEGYEMTFLKDYYDLFKKYIYKFAGELHFLNNPWSRAEFHEMLLKLKEDSQIEFKLYSLDMTDITTSYYDNGDYYTEIIINGYVKQS